MFGVADYGAFVAAIIVFLADPRPRQPGAHHLHRQGRHRGGSAATFGVIAGDQVLMWAAVAGVAALLLAYPAAFHAVQWAGAAYLAWLGLQDAAGQAGQRAGPATSSRATTSSRRP